METCRPSPASKKNRLLAKVSDVFCVFKRYILLQYFYFHFWRLEAFVFFFYLNVSFLRRGLPDREIC